MILDQFELKNMALRFENSAWTTECFDMYSFFRAWQIYVPTLFVADLHDYFLPLNFPFLSLTGVMLHLLLIICLAVACVLTET